MTGLLQDVRLALRSLVKNRGFAAAAGLALALGIGPNTALFSVLHSVLLRPLPYPEPERLVTVWETMRSRRARVTAPDFVDWKAESRSFSGLAAREEAPFTLTVGDAPQRTQGARVSGDYFGLLGIVPRVGRSFTAEDENPGAGEFVVLSEGLWRRRFGADPDVVGRTVRVDGRSHTVVGVVPRTLAWPGAEEELFVPLRLTPEELDAPGWHKFRVVARLAPGVSRTQAEQEMQAIASRIVPRRPLSNTGVGAQVVGLHEQLVGDTRAALLVLFGAVALVTLIACGNVANLLLARGSARRREMAVRASLGANRVRLVRQLLSESVVLAGLGGAAGLVLAFWCLDLLRLLIAPQIPRASEATIDGMTLLFTFLLSVTTGLAFGIVPALQAARLDLTTPLKEGNRGAPGGSRSRARGAFLASQIAITLVLLVGAGLLLRSLTRLDDVKLGFEAENVLAVQLALPESGYDQPAKVMGFYRQLLERLQGLHGVTSAAVATDLPLAGRRMEMALQIAGRPVAALGEYDSAIKRVVSPGYFDTLRIPLVRGRGLAEDDLQGGARVAVINETMARRYWPDQDPIGSRFTLDDGVDAPVEVVGVVGDVRHFGPENAPFPEVFVPLAQSLGLDSSAHAMSLAVRSEAHPAALAASVREVVRSLDREIPLFAVRTLPEAVTQSLDGRRVYLGLLGAFATVALLLAMLGVYGVASYTVAQRTHEFGLRMALGAQARDVRRLVLSGGLKLTAVGMGAGLAGALALTRALAGFLYEVSPADPPTLAAVVALLAGSALLASYLPARRAARVDPSRALREE